MRRGIRFPAALASLSILCLGCAGASFEGFAKESPVAKPSVLLVYDFAVTPEDVVVDTFGSDFAPPEALSQRRDENRTIARELSEAVVAKLREQGINAGRAESWSAVPADALLLKGQFVTINQGSRVARMTIGFGVGREELRVQVQTYQWTGVEMRRIKQAEARAHGDRMPGVAPAVALGAATGGVALVPVIVASGLNIGQEVKGELRPTLGRMADVLAEQMASFYRDQDWL